MYMLVPHPEMNTTGLGLALKDREKPPGEKSAGSPRGPNRWYAYFTVPGDTGVQAQWGRKCLSGMGVDMFGAP
jgi:hypothetical protein